jgi:hypothetical protein
MELTEAQAIVRTLLDTAVNDSVKLALRIDDLKTEQEADPFEGTEAQIKRLQDRHVKKVQEAEALAVIVATF